MAQVEMWLVVSTVLIFHPCLIGGCLRFTWWNNNVNQENISGRNSIHGNIIKPETRSMDKIMAQKSWFIDQSGRTRIFHGFNAVEKGPPWYPHNLLNETKLQLYSDWGFNVVRLGAMWTGFEPNENQFNETYINILKDIIQKLKHYGMYVILDMHQDVMSSKFGGYDGVPLWLMKKLPEPTHSYPWPLPEHVPWFSDYLTEAVGVAFQGLYDNANGALDSMTKFWQKVARTFNDNSFSNVLGYELINEPWAGDIYSKPYLLAPGEAGRDNLAPMYDKLNKAIRLEDNKTLLFYEPVTWGVVFNGKETGSGFSQPPGGSKYRNKSVLSWHYYCWVLDLSKQHFRYPLFQQVICDGILGEKIFYTIRSDSELLGGPNFLTEFGKCDPDGSRQSAATMECDYILHKADQFLTSWTYWDSDFFNKDGNINWNVTLPFTRVFARTISGEPVHMNFDLNSRIFYLKYRINMSIKEPTEIFIPRIHFKHGFTVDINPSLKWTFDSVSQLMHIIQPTSQLHPEYVEVILQPK